MALFNELIGTIEGQMAVVVLSITIGMAIFFIRMFKKKMDNNE